MELDWSIFLLFAIYAAIGIVTLVVWWAIYELVLTRGYNVREAVFGARANPAVAMDLAGGFLATGILIYAIVSLAPRTSFRLNIPAVVASIGVMLVLMTLMRLFLAWLLRAWFGNQRDAQGDLVSINNELFRQRNVATSVFSTVIYLILVAGLVELDIWNLGGYRAEKVLNLLGVWLLGLVLVFVHSFLYLEYGPRNNIMHECFHDNNPAAPISLLGLVAGVLPLNHHLLIFFGPGQHMFNSAGHWYFLGALVIFVLLARGIFQLLLYAFTGINLRYELVIHDNVAWGLLDGGLIFTLCLILTALMV